MSSRLVRTGGHKAARIGGHYLWKKRRKSMTKDEMIMELMELLKANGRPKQAADVFESAAYVDMLESKLDQMTNELVQMRKELQEMKEQQASKSLKETIIRNGRQGTGKMPADEGETL